VERARTPGAHNVRVTNPSQTATLETEIYGQRLSTARAANEPRRRSERLSRPTAAPVSRGNVLLFCGGGNHVNLRGLLGGGEGIRTGDLRDVASARLTECRFRRQWRDSPIQVEPTKWARRSSMRCSCGATNSASPQWVLDRKPKTTVSTSPRGEMWAVLSKPAIVVPSVVKA
jgi:hypothetical protein